MIYKLIYTLSVMGLILNASPASADQRGADQEVKSLTTSIQRLIFGQEETEGYGVSSEGESEGSEDSDGEGPDESLPTQSPLPTSLPQPDFSNMEQENLDPSMDSARPVGSLVLSRASDPRFSDAHGSVEYMSAGTTADGDDLWLRTPLERARSAANSSRSLGTAAPLFRSRDRVMQISEERLNRIGSALANLLASTPAEPLFDESDYPDQFKFGQKPN